jgi:alpha-1,3-rhamnosyl/mannosyltransferase
MFAPKNAEQTRSTLIRYDLMHGQYFIAVGTLEPRKNLQTALLAYQQLPDDVRSKFPMVLIGMKGWHTEALERQMAPLVQSGQLRQLGYVSREALVSLIAGARTMVYPSIYEGFGLPPLEAMACSTPVICSNASSLPEVVGDAGVMVEALDDRALMHAMQKMVDDDAGWTDLKSKSVQRARSFTWAECARRTVEVYKSVIV